MTTILDRQATDPHAEAYWQNLHSALMARTIEATADGCPFARRCHHADERCATFPTDLTIGTRVVRCHHVAEPVARTQEVSE